VKMAISGTFIINYYNEEWGEVSMNLLLRAWRKLPIRSSPEATINSHHSRKLKYPPTRDSGRMNDSLA
jgi:hypothetical protein